MWTQLKSGLSGMLPGSLKRLLRRLRMVAVRRRNRGREVAEIFGEIYEHNRWGGQQGSFHSGSGSTSEHAQQYSRVINSFVTNHSVRRVVDLGCGDFRVGALLLETGIAYTGVDIVETLIRNNSKLYGSERVQFECLDIIEDELPDGDLCLVRQVLQHLSNQQILNVLRNTEKYPYVIVTEHYPAPYALRKRNGDKPCGEDVRVYDGSAVYLDAPPFSRRISGPLLEVDAGVHLMHPGECIRTYLIENEHPSGGNRQPRRSN
jgi:SAM-dependent methyltransferase